MTNFDYLLQDKDFEAFASIAIEAERVYQISAGSCALSCRKAMELAVKGMLGNVRIVNVDVVIIAQAPKLSPYMEQMKQNIASTLGIREDAVNVKATTEEGLGFTGRGEGMAAMATAAIEGSF